MRIFLCAILLVCLTACANRYKADKDDISEALPDDLFAYKNITSTQFIEHFRFDNNSNFEVAADTVTKSAFVYLTPALKEKIMVPVVANETSLKLNYILKYFDARFIAKQNVKYGYTPIIVWINGKDYSALFYILLNKKCTPISYLRISGGNCGGVTETANSLLKLCPVKNSIIKDSIILSYTLTEYRSFDSVPKPSVFDSVNYISNILPSGKIVTKRIDSVRFTRIPKTGY